MRRIDISNRVAWVRLVLALLVLSGVSLPVAAQSTDRDNPTALTSNIIKGAGTGKKTEYFYSFNAGPGDLIITTDLRATAGATGAEVELFDSDSKIFYYYPNATTQNEHAVKHVNLNSKQTVTLRLALDSSAGAYAIKLGGAVEFTQADASQPSGESSSSSDESSTSVKGKLLPPGQLIGPLLPVPTHGTLHIVMKDGTTRDINLSEVKSVSIQDKQ